MITVKMKLLPLVLCLVMLAGCSVGTDGGFELAADMLDSENGKSVSCEIVYAENASPELVEEAKRLAAEVDGQTGMETLVRCEISRYEQGVLYIVLGRTDDKYTEYWFDGMRSDDYFCRISDNIMALGGVFDGATLAAIETFKSDVLPTAEYGWLGDSGILFSHVGEYELDGVFLNGYAWGDYTLLVSDTALLHAAEDIRARIAQSSGEYPRIRVAQNGSEEREIIISVDETFDIPTVEIRAEGADIYVQSDSVYGIYEGLGRLYVLMLEAARENTVRFDISGKLEFKYSDGRINVACVYSDKNTFIGEEKMIELAKEIVDRKIDIAVINLNSDDLIFVKQEISKSYELEYVNDEKTACVIYRKDTVIISDIGSSALGDGCVAEFQVKTVIGEKNYGFIAAYEGVDVVALSEKISSADGDTVVAIAASARITAENCRIHIDEYGLQMLSNNNIERVAREILVRYGYTFAQVQLKSSHPRAVS